MYNVKHGYLLLEIPKNGSRSLVTAACDHHGKQWMKAHGHVTFADFVTVQMPKLVERSRWPNNPIPTYAVFRNPVERFHSQVKQAWRKKNSPHLDDIMQAAWTQSDIVFKPQYEFVQVPTDGDWDIDLRFWDFERLETAMSHIVGRTVKYHKNKDPGTSGVSLDQIMSHKLYDDIMEEHYSEDMHWWLRAMKTKDNGEER